jgi:uncharacterized protein (TIGR03435 family)
MMRSALAVLFLMLGVAQAQSDRKTFEVASIHLNSHCNELGPNRGASSPTQLTLECADLRDLILVAYGVYADGPKQPGRFRMQVTGGP